MVLILYQTFNFFPHLLKDRYVLSVSPKTHSLETLFLMCKYWVGPNKVCLFRSWGPHLTGLIPTTKQLCVSSLLAFCLIIMQQEGPSNVALKSGLSNSGTRRNVALSVYRNNEGRQRTWEGERQLHIVKMQELPIFKENGNPEETHPWARRCTRRQ